MLRSKAEIYMHFVWSTWGREPLVTDAIERRLYRCIAAEAVKKGCKILQLNGMPDHVHLVVKMPTTISVAELAKQVKGVSSTFGRNVLVPGEFFGWQDRYGAFSVSRWDVEMICNYVRNQKEHHGGGALRTELEETEEFADE